MPVRICRSRGRAPSWCDSPVYRNGSERERDVYRRVLWPRTNDKTGVSKHCGVRACAELPPLRSYSSVSSVYLGGDLLRFCGFQERESGETHKVTIRDGSEGMETKSRRCELAWEYPSRLIIPCSVQMKHLSVDRFWPRMGPSNTVFEKISEITGTHRGQSTRNYRGHTLTS
jgi:hypothetical protein